MKVWHNVFPPFMSEVGRLCREDLACCCAAGGVTFTPGSYVYADKDGILVSSEQLKL